MKSQVLAAAVLGVVCSSAALAQGDPNITSRVQQAGPATDVSSSRVANPGPAPVLQGNRPDADPVRVCQAERGRSVRDAARRRYPAAQFAAAIGRSANRRIE
jgi:hypothetical protein